jgi:hypothetical protein
MITLSPEIEQLARLVAARSGVTPEQVLKEAVENQARIAGVVIAEGIKPPKEIDLERVRQITRRVSSKPILDNRTPKEILDQGWGNPG